MFAEVTYTSCVAKGRKILPADFADIRHTLSASLLSMVAIGSKPESLFSLSTRWLRCFLRSYWHGQSYRADNLQKTVPERLNNVSCPSVQFRIEDAYVPEPAQILKELHGKDTLFGKLIDVSDSESLDGRFAVVEVKGLSQPVVVAMKHIRETGYE